MTWARPPWVDRLNAHGTSLGDSALLVSLDPEELLARACESTGLDDFGEDDGWRKNYDVLMNAVNTEAQLHLLGRLLTRHDVLLALRNRLLLTDLWGKRPEILTDSVVAPTFIVGSARTGTTLLHELFAADPANRTPATWELYHPTQALHGEELRSPTDHLTRLYHSIQPEYGTMHTSAGDVPNECIFISMPTFLSEFFSGPYSMPSYDLHLYTASQDQVYKFHRRFLQTLQQRLPSRRWILKSPVHLSRLATLFVTYPDARIIQTHRDPLRTIPSVIDFTRVLKWMRSPHADVSGLPELVAIGTAAAYAAQDADRSAGRLPEQAFIDVRYCDLVADPLNTMEILYRKLGWELTDAAVDGFKARLTQPPSEGHGAHEYSIESLGLDPVTERNRFAEYQTRFNVPNEA